jgi:hypothetical protein
LSPDQEQKLVRDALNKDADDYFSGCDGYGLPTVAGDAMTTAAVASVFVGSGFIGIARAGLTPLK